jgi:hypothetical protein
MVLGRIPSPDKEPAVVMVHPGIGNPTIEKPNAEKPDTNKPKTETPTTEKPKTETPPDTRKGAKPNVGKMKDNGGVPGNQSPEKAPSPVEPEKPAKKVSAEMTRLFLAEMHEMTQHCFSFQQGPFSVGGQAYPKSLLTHVPHPPPGGPAFVRYRVPRAKQVDFKAAIGVSDVAQRPASALVFQVFGDCRLLWTSKPIPDRGIRFEVAADVSGVNVIELRVSSSGAPWWAHAVWLDPRLELTGLDETAEVPEAFLCEMQQIDSRMGPWRFGKGDLGDATPAWISLGGKASPRGLGMHPPADGFSFAKYRISKTGKSFHAKVGLNDASVPGGSASPITFQLLGDTRQLWQSRALQKFGDSDACNVPIDEIDFLELRVLCGGRNQGAHAVWWEPRIEKVRPVEHEKKTEKADPSKAPVIDGVWQEGPEENQIQVAIAQNGEDFTAECIYQHPEHGKVRWELKGTISKDGKIIGRLHHTMPMTWKSQIRIGSISADGRTINGKATFDDGEHDFVWRRKTPLGQKFIPVNIKTVATVSSSQLLDPNHALLFPKWGNQTYHNVPFMLQDPEGGKTKNVICLFSPKNPFAAKLPKTVRLACNSRANSVHFLGAALWGLPWTKTRSASMSVVFEYADGEMETHPLYNGVHLTDWSLGPDVPGSKGIGVKQVRYFAVTPKRQNAMIAAIEFTKGPDETSPFVIGVTVETSEIP